MVGFLQPGDLHGFQVRISQSVTDIGTPSYPSVVEEFNCFVTYTTAEISPFVFTPNPLNPANTPASVTIQGSGFNSVYGKPIVQYFDLSGNLVHEQAVTSVSPDGTTITAETPPVTELGAGTYVGVISNIAADGSYQYVGTAEVEVPMPFYRPTTYSDMGLVDPNDGWTTASSPAGPTLGDFTVGFYTTAVNAFDQYDYDQGGDLDDLLSEQGQCTWSGFQSHVDANNLTLYIPYSISTGGPAANGAFYTVTATIGSSTVTLYSAFASGGSGLLTASVPAGVNLSTIQVAVTALPLNQNPGNPGTVSDTISLDMYVQ
jgi:hypothetical protein